MYMPAMQKIFIGLTNALVLLSLAACSGTNNSDQQAVDVKLIAVNDFHGQLQVVPSDSGAKVSVLDPTANTGVSSLYAGGGAYLASLVKQLKASNENSIVIAAGDIIGAAQPISSLTSEEAAIDVMGEIGLEVTSVGNHEFDKGKDELLRMQNGGCKPANKGGVIGQTTCIINRQFAGAKFKYLAANVIDQSTNQPLLPGTYTKKFGSVTVGFVGLTLQATPSSTSGAGGLTFLNEAAVINEKTQELKNNGADAVVVLIHQGGQTSAPYINDQSCPGLTGLIGPIVTQLRNVDVVVSGHTHQEYICNDVNGTNILLTSAGLFGRMVTDINLKIIPGKGVVQKNATTLPVLNNLNSTLPSGYQRQSADSATLALIDIYNAATAGPLGEVQGYTAQKLSNCQRTQTLETPLGDVVADAYLASYNSGNPSNIGHIAFTNVGGLRANIDYTNGGAVTYGALYTVAPFGNALVYKAMTGAQIKRLLEQQWEATNCSEKQLPSTSPVICGRLLQPSNTLRYSWDWSRGQGQPVGQGNLLTSVEIYYAGTWHSIVDTDTYGVITNAFLAGGGDKFTVFKEQTNDIDFGQTDLMALEDYFAAYPSSNPLLMPAPIGLPADTKRATCVNCPNLSQADQQLCQ